MDDEENSYAQDGSVQIGPVLEKARRELGQTYEDVERVTKIRARYLEAMERDDFEALPGPIYARGFLKTYANYLDLDGESLAEEFRSQWLSQAPLSPEQEDQERAGERSSGDGRTLSRSGRFRRPRRFRMSPITILGSILGLLILAVVVTSLYFVGLQASNTQNESSPQNSPQAEENAAPEGPGEGDPSQNPDNETPEQEAAGNGASDEAVQQGNGSRDGEVATPSQQQAPQEPAPEETPPPEPPSPESLVMELRVEGNISWLNIEADGDTVFSQVAESGFVQTFEAEESITVWSGNAGAVFISVNGQDYGQLGGSGQTVVREFDLETLGN